MAESRGARRPDIFFTIMVLLAVLVLYPLIGSGLTFLATGGRLIDPEHDLLDPALLQGLRIAQVVGQVLALGLPAFLLAWRYSGSRTLFGAQNLFWLGIRRPAGLRPILMASGGMLLLQPLMYTITEVQNLGLPYLGETGKAMLRNQEQLEFFIRKIAAYDSVSGFLAVAAVLAVTPALCEELFFRGYVQKSFSSSMSPSRALLLTGFLFALFHLEPSNIIPLTLLGWYIGYIYQKSCSLAVPAVAHGTNNLAALLFLFIEQRFSDIATAEGTPGVVSMWQWWILVIVTLAIFFVLMRRFPEPVASAQS